MASYSIDTARAKEQLESVRVPSDQASVIVDLLAQSHEQVASKSDVEQLSMRIDHLEKSTKADNANLEASMKVAIANLEASTKADIEQLEMKLGHLENSIKSELSAELSKLHTRIVVWVVGTGVAIFGGERIINLITGG